MPIANDDLYAQSWNTNFGSNTFDDSPSELSQNTEETEYIPIQIPENNHPPQKNRGGSTVEQTIEPDENHENEIPQQISEVIKKPKKLKTIQIIHQTMRFKKPQKTPKIPHYKKNP